MAPLRNSLKSIRRTNCKSGRGLLRHLGHKDLSFEVSRTLHESAFAQQGSRGFPADPPGLAETRSGESRPASVSHLPSQGSSLLRSLPSSPPPACTAFPPQELRALCNPHMSVRLATKLKTKNPRAFLKHYIWIWPKTVKTFQVSKHLPWVVSTQYLLQTVYAQSTVLHTGVSSGRSSPCALRQARGTQGIREPLKHLWEKLGFFPNH